MANVKPEDSDNPLWQGGYSLQMPINTRPPTFDSNYPTPPLNLQYNNNGRPLPKTNYRSLDIPSLNARPQPQPQLQSRDRPPVLTASPPSLAPHHSYPSLKRPFHASESASYGDGMKDFREDASEAPKSGINQDHRLLYFTRHPDKQTVIDAHGRVKHVELTAQIHGMFFLSEMAAPAGEGLPSQPELTCYRRNIFQISGNVTMPREPLSVVSARGERVPVVSMEVAVSATESVDGHNVRLIVIPWKTPPANSPEIPQSGEQEPLPIPLQPLDQESGEGDLAVYPIAYRRLQFRIATANNGRRRELQQHFTLHLNIKANLANGTSATIVETSTAPIVVRGRSPRNFQARKEIPLVGSSSARGPPPEMITAAGGSVVGKPKVAKAHSMDALPQTTFNFDASNLPPSPMAMRQQSYPSWTGPQHISEQNPSPTNPSFPPPPYSMDSYLQANRTNQELPSSHSPPTTMPPPQQPPLHQQQSQYPYHPNPLPSTGAVPIRFVDSNPRPTKSPRHIGPSEAPSSVSSSYPAYGSRYPPAPYSAGNPESQPTPQGSSRDYYPPSSMPMNSWTTGADVNGIYGTSLPVSTAPPGHHLPQHYEPASNGAYPKEEPGAPHQHYGWNPA
ncbi:hypothetical protein B7463_g9641, partial [Scytalidium lignicola]